MIINRPAYHPNYPPTSKYVRATTLLVGNIIEPVRSGDMEYTRLTQVAHVNPGGAGDNSAAAFVINKLCAVGPPSFIRKLELAAQKSDNMNKKARIDSAFKLPSFKSDIDNIKNKLASFTAPEGKDSKLSGKKKSLVAAFASSKNFFSQ